MRKGTDCGSEDIESTVGKGTPFKIQPFYGNREKL